MCRCRARFYSLVVGSTLLTAFTLAQTASFHNAPASAAKAKNPVAGQAAAIDAGKKLYAQNCASCHGAGGEGTGNIPALKSGPTQAAKDGEVFWFITKGSVDNGMPAWSGLSEAKRWQIVSYLKAMKTAGASAPRCRGCRRTCQPLASGKGSVHRLPR